MTTGTSMCEHVPRWFPFEKIECYIGAMVQKRVLIVGGTSGLGRELGELISGDGAAVFVTGRTDPQSPSLTFVYLNLGSESAVLSHALDQLVQAVKPIDILVYAAGFSQQGTLDVLDDTEILKMIHISLSVPAMLVQRFLREQHGLSGLILITSTSQEKPRLEEPVYSSAKAGLAMLGQSLSLDTRIKKTLVVAPAGMDTKMWKGTPRLGTLLNPHWVAQQVLHIYKNNFKYKFIRVLRDPARIQE